MKHFWQLLIAKYKFFVFVVLKPLGVWGLAAMGVVDSSSIALPLDALVASYVWADKPKLLLYTLMTAVGTALGSLVPFLIGRAGGELFLLKRVNRERFEKLRDRFERQEFLAIAIPAMLPPPTPFKLFVFAAGVFEMRVLNFLLAVFVGRFLRYTLLALLVVRYGPQITQLITAGVRQHLFAFLIVFGLLAALLGWVLARQFQGSKRNRKREESDE